jgi:hypothetical protein
MREIGGNTQALAIVPILFGMAHPADWPLAGICIGAELVWTALDLRGAPMWAPGICPAWPGTIA